MRDKIDNIVGVPSGCETTSFILNNSDVGLFEIYDLIPCEITIEIEFRSFNGYGILNNVINTVSAATHQVLPLKIIIS